MSILGGGSNRVGVVFLSCCVPRWISIRRRGYMPLSAPQEWGPDLCSELCLVDRELWHRIPSFAAQSSLELRSPGILGLRVRPTPSRAGLNP